MKSINFKLLTEKDLLVLHNWFQKTHIKQWYARNENYTLDMIKKKYLPRILNPESIPNFIIYADNTPIGYIQLYCVNDSLPDGVTDYSHPLFDNFKPNEIAGLDLFIADENYLKKGYATLILTNFIKQYVQNKFTLLVTDPLKNNENAIQFFMKNGFKNFCLINLNQLMNFWCYMSHKIEQPLLTSASDQEIAESYKHFMAQFEPQHVVDIAFKTDENLI